MANAHFEVLLPQSQDPVTYEIILQGQAAAQPDTLAPCDYLISWVTDSHGNEIKGFSAYFDGHHYRLRNNKLQEYHYAEAPEPFSDMRRGVRGGVQQSAQFAEYLPQFLADKFRQMTVDTSYRYAFHPDTLVRGKHRIVVDGTKITSGYESAIYEYVFDKDTGMPVSVSLVNSPGSISEQLIDVTYGPTQAEPVQLTEAGLIAQWPEEFELYRQSSFRSENLVGKPLPSYTCAYLDGKGRAEHMAGQPLPRPMAIVVIDPQVSSSAATISAMRQAVDAIPTNIDLAWAFSDNNADEALALIGELLPGEQAWLSARSLVRNSGITLFPTVMLINSDSTVADVIPGYNKELSEIVIQKAMLLH